MLAFYILELKRDDCISHDIQYSRTKVDSYVLLDSNIVELNSFVKVRNLLWDSYIFLNF